MELLWAVPLTFLEVLLDRFVRHALKPLNGPFVFLEKSPRHLLEFSEVPAKVFTGMLLLSLPLDYVFLPYL